MLDQLKQAAEPRPFDPALPMKLASAKLELETSLADHDRSPEWWSDAGSYGLVQAGLNVVVFKVVNMRGRWGGSLRFADKDGKPIQGFKVTLNPDQGTRPEAMTRK